MDFRQSALESQNSKSEAQEPDWIDVHIDPVDPETGEEARPVRLALPTSEQIAIYSSIYGGSSLKMAEFMHGTLELLKNVALDDGYERLLAKFQDRNRPDWDLVRLRQIVQGLFAEVTGRPTEPSSDSSSSRGASGRSSTATSSPKASTRSRSTRVDSSI